MKTRHFAVLSLAACTAAVSLSAQETVVTSTAVQPQAVVPAATTTTTSTTTAGTIQSFTPGTSQVILRTAAGAPVTYTYSKRTTFVDATGNVVSAETIRPGEPTTVYYALEAGQPVVSRIVVNRTVAPAVPVTQIQRTETTTTTTHSK